MAAVAFSLHQSPNDAGNSSREEIPQLAELLISYPWNRLGAVPCNSQIPHCHLEPFAPYRR